MWGRDGAPENRGRFPASGLGPHNIRAFVPWETLTRPGAPPAGGRPGPDNGSGPVSPPGCADDDDPAG